MPLADATAALERVDPYALPRSAYVEAGLLPGDGLRSLDGLHITGALRLEADVVLIYDHRMREAAVANGLKVLAPGDPSWPEPPSDD